VQNKYNIYKGHFRCFPFRSVKPSSRILKSDVQARIMGQLVKGMDGFNLKRALDCMLEV